jgi:sec-independent protein translocase protein TatC
VLLKTALFGGVFLSVPFILYQMWLFIGPGLYDHEKKAVIPFVMLSYVFFLMGAAFSFWVVLPKGYEFLLTFSLPISQPELMMSEYLAITTKLVIGFGVIFQLPVVIMFLSSIGIVTHRHLLKFWRYAVVISFIVAAILTPPDVVTQVLMAVPLSILYFLSIGVAWYFTTKRERRAALENT